MVDLERLARITSIAQAQGVAVLVRDQIELVAKLGLDGVHLSASEHITADVARARAALGRDSIVGASAGLSRHLAMSLAELGADYVGVDLDKDDSGAQSRLLEFVAWWGEIIEVPCVAFGVETPEFAQSLAANGADFIAMTLLAGTGAEAAGVSARTFDTAIKGPVTKDT